MEKPGRIVMLLEMLEKEPNDLFLNYALGIEYFSSGELNKAIQQFGKVIELEPSHIPAHYQMGKVLEAQANHVQALEFYRKGLELARIKKDNKAINEFGEAIFMLED